MVIKTKKHYPTKYIHYPATVSHASAHTIRPNTATPSLKSNIGPSVAESALEPILQSSRLRIGNGQ